MSDKNQSVNGMSRHGNHSRNTASGSCLSGDNLEGIGDTGSTCCNNVIGATAETQVQSKNAPDLGQEQQQQENQLVLYSPNLSLSSTPGHKYVQPPPHEQVPILSSLSTPNNIGLPDGDEMELFGKICKKRKTLEAEKDALREQILSLERAAAEQREKCEAQLATEREQAEEDRKLYQTWREKVEEQNDKLVIKGKLIESQAGQLAELKSSLEYISATNKQQEQEIAEKSADLARARAKIGELETAKNESVVAEIKLGSEISDVTQKLLQADQVNASLKSEIGDLKQLTEYSNKKFKQTLREFGDTVKMKQREIVKLRRERDSLQRHCETLLEEIAALTGERDLLTGELESKTEVVRKIVDEEKKFRRESALEQLLKREEINAVATSTAIKQPLRSAKRKSSFSHPKNIPGHAPVTRVVATADTTIGSTGPNPKQKRRGN